MSTGWSRVTRLVTPQEHLPPSPTEVADTPVRAVAGGGGGDGGGPPEDTDVNGGNDRAVVEDLRVCPSM